MLLLTTILLLLSGMALGLARRSWWEVGVLTLLVWGSLCVTNSWIGNWRGQLGLPHDERLFEPQVIVWLLVGVYVSYVLAFLCSRCWLPSGPKSDR